MAMGSVGFNPFQKMLEEMLGQQVPQTGVQSLPDLAKQGNFGTPPAPPSFGDRAGGFFGNLDNTLNSPSKILGLGLLGRINPGLSLLGLLGGGLFGGNKVL